MMDMVIDYPSATHRARSARSKGHMFSQTAEYALRAVMHLVEQPDGPASSETISRAMQVPRPYLSKVLRDLVVAELVASVRGPNGGFVLARPASRITVLDVVNAVDPIKRITECPLGRPDHQQLCRLHRQMDSAIEHVECSLRSTTLDQLAGNTGVLASLPRPATADPSRRSKP
jgi:Rrf2 family protein